MERETATGALIDTGACRPDGTAITPRSMTHTDVIPIPAWALPIPAPDGPHPHLASQTLSVNHQPSYAHTTAFLHLAKSCPLMLRPVFTLLLQIRIK